MKVLIISGGMRTQQLDTRIAKFLLEVDHKPKIIPPFSTTTFSNVESYQDFIIQHNPDVLYYETMCWNDLEALKPIKAKKILNHTAQFDLDCYDFDFDIKHFDCMLTSSWQLHKKYRYSRRMGHYKWFPLLENKLSIEQKRFNRSLVDCTFVGSHKAFDADDKICFFNNGKITKDIWGKNWQHSDAKGLWTDPNVCNAYYASKSAFATLNDFHITYGLKPRRFSEIFSAVCPIFVPAKHQSKKVDWYNTSRWINFADDAEDMNERISVGWKTRRSQTAIDELKDHVTKDGPELLLKLRSMIEN